MSEQKHELIEVLGRQSMMNTEEFWDILSTTIVPSEFSANQTMVFLAICHSLNLNPINGEIHPMLHKGRVQPLVGIDGWVRRANDHKQFDGMDVSLSESGTECTVSVYRKDRSHPVTITEYLAECKKDTGPWKSHPKRMLRHRGIIQAIRLAFGSGGAVDEDDRHYFEAVDATVMGTPVDPDVSGRVEALREAIGEAVGEPEPNLFKTEPQTSCNAADCRKRLVRLCEGCGRHFCEDHWDKDTSQCFTCEAIDKTSDEEPAQVDEADVTPDPNKYPQNPGKDPMEKDEPDTLPWD